MKFNQEMRIRIRVRGAQASTEMLVVLAVLLIVFLIVVGMNQDIFTNSARETESNRARTAVDTLGRTAELVHLHGQGSKEIVRIELPASVSSLTVANQRIHLVSAYENTSTYYNLNFPVTGSLPVAQGTYSVTVESLSDGVHIFQSDKIKPSSVSDLTSPIQDVLWLYWTWTNPADADFSSNIIFLDGVQKTTTSNNFYNATGLQSEKSYTITVHTQDTSGNINETDVNHTTSTIAPTGLTTEIIALSPQTCVAEDATDKGVFDGSCDGQYPLSCGDGDDLLRCDDNFVETHTALRSGKNYYYGGVMITAYDATISNCYNITQVKLCYQWWRNALLQDCDVSVDANGGGSFSAVTTSCPDTSSSTVTCTDVTALETWTCSNFFGASGTRATAKSEGQRSGGPGSTTVSWDVMFFNVTYLKT